MSKWTEFKNHTFPRLLRGVTGLAIAVSLFLFCLTQVNIAATRATPANDFAGVISLVYDPVADVVELKRRPASVIAVSSITELVDEDTGREPCFHPSESLIQPKKGDTFRSSLDRFFQGKCRNVQPGTYHILMVWTFKVNGVEKQLVVKSDTFEITIDQSARLKATRIAAR